ncbi:MAG: serine protease [Patescibacteria group bacterium]
MTLLLKIGVYLLGALALLFVVVPPEQTETPNETRSPTETLPLAQGDAEAAAEESEEKIATKSAQGAPTPEPEPLPAPKPLAPVSITQLPTIHLQLPTNPSPLLPPAQQAPFTTPATPVAPAFSFDDINKQTRAALQNILCTTLRSGSFNPVSGSGILIDPRGVILTNAHVAQYFLLKDYLVKDFVRCVIRAGEPARPRYKARLLYIAPQWIERNARKITEGEATGTGEHDFALLLITESVNPETLPLPGVYPFLPLDASDETLRKKRAPVLVAAYPAGFLGGIHIQKELYPVSSVTETGSVFTFRGNTPDAVSITGSPLGQQGASGGAVVTGEAKLLGIISTASVGATTGERELHAITGAHLERSFAERNAFSIKDMLAEADLAKLSEEFNANVAPQLTKLLENELERN